MAIAVTDRKKRCRFARISYHIEGHEENVSTYKFGKLININQRTVIRDEAF